MPKRINPGILSSLTVSWIYPLLKLAKEQRITKNDLYELNDSDKSYNMEISSNSLMDALSFIKVPLFFVNLFYALSIVSGLFVLQALKKVLSTNQSSLNIYLGIHQMVLK